MALWLVVLFTSQLRSSWDRTNSLKNSWLETNQSDFWNKIRNHSWVKYVNEKRNYKTMHITILWTSHDVLTGKSSENCWVRQYWKAIEKIREIRMWRRLLKWFDKIKVWPWSWPSIFEMLLSRKLKSVMSLLKNESRFLHNFKVQGKDHHRTKCYSTA